MLGGYRSSEFYIGDRSTPMYSSKLDIWSNLTFNIIERSGQNHSGVVMDVVGNRLNFYKGDSVGIKVNLVNKDGTPYSMQSGDKLHLKIASSFGGSAVLSRESTFNGFALTSADTNTLRQVTFFMRLSLPRRTVAQAPL